MKQQLRAEILSTLSDVNYISAKYFYKDTEIKNIDKYISRTICNNLGYLCNQQDLNEVKTLLINWSSDEKIWPKAPIVQEALKLGPIEEKITLPFPLTKKQIVIINRLLFHPEDERLFITTGKGQTGKSTFLNIIKQLFDNDYSSTTVSDLSNGFMVAEAVKHRLICSDELGKGDLDTKILKQLASKQDIALNPKNLPPHEIRSQSALFWCCNTIPKIDATDSGILRRIVYYERNKVIENPDPSLNDKVYTHEELLTIARRALAYEDPNWFELFKKETYINIMKNNSVYICEKNKYEEYVETCRNKGLKAYSEPNFNSILELFNYWKKSCLTKDTM